MHRFEFTLWPPIRIEGEPTKRQVETLTARAETVEEAYTMIEPQIPEGMKLFCWFNADFRDEPQ